MWRAHVFEPFSIINMGWLPLSASNKFAASNKQSVLNHYNRQIIIKQPIDSWKNVNNGGYGPYKWCVDWKATVGCRSEITPRKIEITPTN